VRLNGRRCALRYLAIGDIHGCFQALRSLEAVVPFRANDTIIALGDYVDRGPDSCAVLDWLIARQRGGILVALRGNHEVMMLQAREGDEHLREWLACGGDATLASYSILGDEGRLVDVPDEHWEFLQRQTRPWFEIESHFFVHANAYPDCPLDQQPDYLLYWEPFGEPQQHCSGKIMVCGHTPQKNGRPRSVGHAVCLDTWGHGRGWLSCLDVATGRYWQANQGGETRTGWLEED
jgi:serine/threonine protein phosphatase 1